MDFGHNHFTGYIPGCLSNIKGMTSPIPLLDFSRGVVSEVMQGIERSYTSSLPYLVDIDLSCNNLVGNIPHDMTKISGLMGLNLPYNQLSGTIPENIGSLKSLISLDLSKNKLRAKFLSKKCRSKVNKQDKGTSNEGKGRNKEILEKMGSDLVVMSGFATGFWGVVGCLVLNRRWRHAFFRRLEDGYNWLYVRVALRLRAAKSKINRR
ncbi:uncharacterized protein LOC141608666 [Silene latifolia]|uniref:uncharacterized protein LOC141608666 n=1 Tax=Silene latifolia TaxID=37657 RepID=UPI003D7893D3